MFRIGQKVVCVKSHSLSFVIKGRIYEIKGFDTCRCKSENISLLLKGVGNINTGCRQCRYIHREGTAICSTLFAPLDESFADEVLKNIAEQIEEENLVTI